VIPLQVQCVVDLPSLDRPADQYACGNTHGKRRRNRQHRVTLDAFGGIIQEFFGSIAAPFRGAPHYSHAILYCVGNRTGCARSLVRRFGDAFSSSFHYGL
jgi:hypothetical protein